MIMISGKIFRKAGLFLLVSSLMLNLAMASSFDEPEDFSEGFDGDMPLGNFGPEQKMDVFEEFPPGDLVEIVVPKQRNGMKSAPQKDQLIMVPFQASIKGTIQDETGITGVNGEKKHLPPSVKRQEITAPLMQDIRYQVIENYLPITPQEIG